MFLKVKEFIDDDPMLLFKELKSGIDRRKGITLDFHSIQSVPFEFLEATIGKLLDDYSFNKISNHINFTNVDVGIKEMLAKIVKEKT